MARSVFDSREGKRLNARRHFFLDAACIRELTEEERAEQGSVETQIDLLQFADAIVRGEIAGRIDRKRQAAECLQKFLDADRAYRDAIDGGRLDALTKLAARATDTTTPGGKGGERG